MLKVSSCLHEWDELMSGIQPCCYSLDLFRVQDPGTQRSTDCYRLRTSLHMFYPNMTENQMISVGCSLAAYGELHFEMFGFLCQAAAVAFEASRLVMIQILLHGLKVCQLRIS